VAVVGGLVGGAVTQLGEYLRLRHASRMRWSGPLRDASAEVSAFYASIRDQISGAVRASAEIPRYDVLFADVAGAHARLFTLPGGEAFEEPLKKVWRSTESFWTWAARGTPDPTGEEFQHHRRSTLESIREFQESVRAKLSS
jgi:hypothetical protein